MVIIKEKLIEGNTPQWTETSFEEFIRATLRNFTPDKVHLLSRISDTPIVSLEGGFKTKVTNKKVEFTSSGSASVRIVVNKSECKNLNKFIDRKSYYFFDLGNELYIHVEGF